MAASFHRQYHKQKKVEKPQTLTPNSKGPLGGSSMEWAGQGNKGRASLIRSQSEKKRRIYVYKIDKLKDAGQFDQGKLWLIIVRFINCGS